MSGTPGRPEVAVIYCPLWHNYDHMSSWKGEGWCEWELLKSAKPRFKGHYQPLHPSWGCFDESDPKWSAREIALAASHNIDVFIYDWYWYSGVEIMEEGLHDGFLKAPSRRRLKFALMWANHDWSDWFPAPFDKPWNSWLPSRHTPDDLERVIDACATRYFRQPNYWRVDGRLFLSLFLPDRFIDQLGGEKATRRLLARVDRRLAAKRLPPVHWNGMLWDESKTPMLDAAGFHSTTSYNLSDARTTSRKLTQEYAELVAAHNKHWHTFDDMPLVHCPAVTVGWDVTPRCDKNLKWPFPPNSSGKHAYPYTHVVVNNTPELFEKLCRDAREYVAQAPATKKPFAVFVNAWNEWTEGSYLLPEKRTGKKYLEALKRAFGR